MKNLNVRHTRYWFMAVSGLMFLVLGVPALAQQPTARERELEDLIRKLSEKVDRLEERLDRDSCQRCSRRSSEFFSAPGADHSKC